MQEGKNYSELKPTFSGESTIVYYLKQRAPEFENEYELLDLIEKMLRLNHHSRFSASECLSHDFFKMDFPSEAILSGEFLEQRKMEKEHPDVLKKKVKLM